MSDLNKKYFERENFYEWGSDIDIMKVINYFDEESTVVLMMLRNKRGDTHSHQAKRTNKSKFYKIAI